VSAAGATRRLDWILSPEPRLEPEGPGAGLTIGVLALQGDFREHRVALERLGCATREVRHARDLEALDGLVLPGGESTTIHKLLAAEALPSALGAFHAGGGAVYGTCAGLITVARETVEGYPPTLGIMDVVARRNAFGRQVASFEVDLEVKGLPGAPVRAVFIRAPWIERAGPGVEILAEHGGHAVAAREGRVLVTAFHPELTDDLRLHQLFIAMIGRRLGGATHQSGPGTAEDGVDPGRRARRAEPAAVRNR
jgi:pyridoxal 5'-phosphate synthase pdxT subunit